VSRLRAHPGRVLIVLLVLGLLGAVLAISLVLTSGSAGPPLAESDRTAGRAAIAVLQAHEVPAGMDRTSPRAVEDAARYEWALARLSERARERGIPAPSDAEITRYLTSYAKSCCDGDIAEMIRRARRAGASHADLERAAARRADYTNLQREISKELPAPSAEQVSAEIRRAPALYRRQPASRPTKLYMCTDRACGEAVIAALAEGRDDAQIAELLRGRDRRNGIVAESAVGPGGDSRLWAAVRTLPTGEWPDAPVATGLAPWVVPVPLNKMAPGKAIAPDVQRTLAETTLRNLTAAEVLAGEISTLMAQAR